MFSIKSKGEVEITHKDSDQLIILSLKYIVKKFDYQIYVEVTFFFRLYAEITDKD